MTVYTWKPARSWLSELQFNTTSAITSIFGGRSSLDFYYAAHRSRPAHLQVSPGISESARLVQDTVDDLAIDIEHWLVASQYRTEDVDHDMLILLPPNRQIIANVSIIARRRPQMLIAPDDFATAFVDTDLPE